MAQQQITLEAQKRADATKGELNAMRRSGRIPAVTYGDGESPIAISVDEKAFLSAIHTERGRNALIDLKVEGKSHAVLIKELQRHIITRSITHIDFHRVSLKKKIETAVPIHIKGEAPGVKTGGGVLEHILRDVRVKCLPTEIPASIDVDISSLQINQSVKAKDLPVPEGVELLIPGDTVVLHVVAPTILEETTPAAGAAAPGAAASTEPEVIKKGKQDEEAAAGATGDKKAAPAAAAKPEAKK